MEFELLFLLFLAGVVAGVVDAIAGGGGLITIPALLLSGLPPLQALGTNKCQGMFGTLIASSVMIRKKVVHLPDMKKSIVFVAIGSALGTLLVQFIDKSTLEFMIPVVLVLMTLYTVFSPKASDIEATPRMSEQKFEYVNGAVGFYDGVLGPGTGSLFALSHVGLRGKPIKIATGQAKILNFTSNVASAVVFLVGGYVVWMAAFVMIIGQIIGGYIGANLVISKGTHIIKPMIAVTSMAMLVKYFFF